MNILIVEDEQLAAERLSTLINRYDSSYNILASLDTVRESVSYIAAHKNEIDLIFMDIELADGQSFEIFDHLEVTCPIIFVTAYDQYALNAFKVNSIDYLMKPITFQELKAALDKYKTLTGSSEVDSYQLGNLLKTEHKSRFLVKSGQRMYFKHVPEISHFYAEDKYCYLVESKTARKYLIDYKLEKLEEVLDPSDFFRINRSTILKVDSIREIRKHDATRYQVSIAENANPLVVSRTRTNSFKDWLEG